MVERERLLEEELVLVKAFNGYTRELQVCQEADQRAVAFGTDQAARLVEVRELMQMELEKLQHFVEQAKTFRE